MSKFECLESRSVLEEAFLSRGMKDACGKKDKTNGDSMMSKTMIFPENGLKKELGEVIVMTKQKSRRKVKENMSSNNLILTGWGWPEYACAAALALRHFKDADVLGMSTRRLPEFLDGLKAPSWRTIVIFGIGLTGDPERLASALKRLKTDGVRVFWISALPIPDELSPRTVAELKKSMKIYVNEDGLLEASGALFNLSFGDLTPLLHDKPRAAYHKACRTLLDAAMYAYRNYQDEVSYGAVIRHIANSDPEKSWTPAEHKLMAHYQRYGGRELAGRSDANLELLTQINRVAPHDEVRVLICGESGTGKETVAQLIHNKSPRREEPFLAFNCSSVTPNLLESRFFGHEKGSFTGANERKDGLFALANGGTLFLDEIGELPLEAQGILLRVLEGGRFTRLGGTEELETNVRLITATNRDLAAMVRDGKFREDLFFRLNMIQIRIPPLRERISDVKQIADGWWLKHCGHRLKQEQLAVLMSYDYPGNVRELINLLERATVFENTDFAKIIEDNRSMTANLRSGGVAEAKPVVPECPATVNERIVMNVEDVPDDLESVIRLHVRRVYEKYDRNLTKTAEALQIARNTLKKYLK